jgi:hypothetical protein
MGDGHRPAGPSFEAPSLENEAFESILSTANLDALELPGWELGRNQFAKCGALFEGVGERMTFVTYVCEVLGEHLGGFRVDGEARTKAFSHGEKEQGCREGYT